MRPQSIPGVPTEVPAFPRRPAPSLSPLIRSEPVFHEHKDPNEVKGDNEGAGPNRHPSRGWLPLPRGGVLGDATPRNEHQRPLPQAIKLFASCGPFAVGWDSVPTRLVRSTAPVGTESQPTLGCGRRPRQCFRFSALPRFLLGGCPQRTRVSSPNSNGSACISSAVNTFPSGSRVVSRNTSARSPGLHADRRPVDRHRHPQFRCKLRRRRMPNRRNKPLRDDLPRPPNLQRPLKPPLPIPREDRGVQGV